MKQRTIDIVNDIYNSLSAEGRKAYFDEMKKLYGPVGGWPLELNDHLFSQPRVIAHVSIYNQEKIIVKDGDDRYIHRLAQVHNMIANLNKKLTEMDELENEFQNIRMHFRETAGVNISFDFRISDRYMSK